MGLRCGKAAPPGNASGRASAAASDSTPRIPPQLMSVISFTDRPGCIVLTRLHHPAQQVGRRIHPQHPGPQ